MGATKLLAKLLRREKREKGRQGSGEDRPPSVSQSDSSTLIAEHEESGTKESQQGEPSQSVKELTSGQLFKKLFPNRETLGLHILYTPPETTKPVVDIVFVHGLKGSAYTTWLDTHSGTYWPYHLLPHDVPDARIMTFGYDGDPAGILMVGENNIRDHAYCLIGDLERERRADPHRKLVFIVHSLGGLITKKALCMSESNAERHLNDVERGTRAIAFFGTPHRGSGLATFAKGVAEILKLVNFKMNVDILESLKRNSQVLADIEDSFTNWLRKKGDKVDLTCFYEELALPVTGMVVTKDSAQIPGYPQIPIHAHHRDMGKFGGLNDPGYKRIVGEIERWLDRIELKQELSSLDKECLQSLAFPEMNERGIDINPAVGGTCGWILEQKAYLKWLYQGRSLLWIKGKPGAGKSTLLKYVLQSLQQEKPLSSDRTVTISFFFHGRGSEIQRTPLGLFRSLLHQLLESFPNSLSELVQTFKSRLENQGTPGEKWNWRPLELQTFLESSLPRVLEESAIRIVVDALDECGEKAAKDLVKFFQRLRSKCSSPKHGLNICFSCRHFPLVSLDNGLEICVEDENHEDIKKYIRNELQDLIEQDKELEVLEDEIITRSSYVFQWVNLVLSRAISQHNEGCSLLHILQCLRDTPAELHSLYEDILGHLDNSKDKRAQSLQLMQWICFATRPLSLTELRFAMVVDWNTSYIYQDQLQTSPNFVSDDTKMERRVKALSGGLAEIKPHSDGSRVVQFIHQSVNDYLAGGGLRVLDASESAYMAIGRAHYRLSRSCIKYFAMFDIYHWMTGLEHDGNVEVSERGKMLQRQFPFLEYTLSSWGQHAKWSEDKSIPQVDLLYYWNWPGPQFFDAWIEVCMFISLHFSQSPARKSILLHAAAAYGIISLSSAILEDLSSRNQVSGLMDSIGWEPIHYAVSNGHADAVRLLLDRGNADPDAGGFGASTPLAVAAMHGYDGIVRLLVQTKRVNVNSRGLFGLTPLSEAAEAGYESVVRYLLQCEGIATDSRDKYEMSAVSRAAKGGHESIVKLLMEHNPVDSRTQDKTALLAAARGGNGRVVEMVLENSNIDINLKIDGFTALLLAIQKGNVEAATVLLKHKGIDVNCEDNNGMTPLFYAAEYGLHGMMSSLLAHDDLDVDFRDKYGASALTIAARNADEKGVYMLLRSGRVDVNSKEGFGRSILTHAAGNGWERIAKLLISNTDLDVNPKDDEMRTALSFAAADGNEEMVKLLLQCDGIDTDCPDKDGKTALSWAAEEGHANVVELLKSHGAS